MIVAQRSGRVARWSTLLAVRAWVLAWSWAHPAAGPALTEALEGESEAARGWRVAPRLALFALGVPLFARRQAAAERAATTRTAGSAALSDGGRWRGRAREALVWAVLAGWVVAFALYLHSDITTGKFAPDYAPAPGEPEVISVQFHLAALAAGVPSLVLGVLLVRAWLGRR